MKTRYFVLFSLRPFNRGAQSLFIGDSVNLKRTILYASLVLVGTPHFFGQIKCPISSVKLPLVCLVPDSTAAYGSSSATPNYFSAAQQAALPVNGSIGAQLTQLPIPSGTAGTITLGKKSESDTGHSYSNLGPVLIEQPGTVGEHHLYAGLTFQHFSFNAIDGINLKNLTFGYAAQGQDPTTGHPTTYYGSNSAKVSFKLDQYVALFIFGISKTTDVSVVVPFDSISVSTTTSNYVSYSYDSDTNTYSKGSALSAPPIHGSASGIGDMTFGVKQLVYGAKGTNLAVALGAGLRIPSGYAPNFLGSGAYGFNVYGLVSYRPTRARISPHMKLGSVWNGTSELVNPASGAGDAHLPGGMQYAIGVDSRIRTNLTAAVDILGNQFTNGLVLHNSPIALNPVPGTINSGSGLLSTLPANQPVNSTYTAVNLGVGLKYAPMRGLQVYGNVLVQLNNVGLRSYPVPLGGISYNWGKTE